MSVIPELLDVFFKKSYSHFDKLFSSIEYSENKENSYCLLQDESK